MKVKETLPIGVVCHDAGAANQIVAFLKSQRVSDFYGYLEGPARKLWDLNFPEEKSVASLDALFDISETLLTGTSWSSDLEHRARLLASQMGMTSITLLDHWVNFETRFTWNGFTMLPDKFWVVDEYAFAIAADIFEGKEIQLIPDTYMEQMLINISQSSVGGLGNILYLLEPIRSNWGLSEPGELQALRYFLTNFSRLKVDKNTAVCLRLHPSETVEKYNSVIQEFPDMDIEFDSGSLADAIARAIMVVGCQTYAMTIAIQLGIPVVSSMPPWAPSSLLPHSGIIELRNMTQT